MLSSIMANIHYTLNFGLRIAARTKSISTARKIVTKLVKWQSLVVKCFKIRKYSLVNVCIEFVYIIVLRLEKPTAFEPKLYKVCKFRKAIFCVFHVILQPNFAISLCKFLFGSKFSL